MTTLAQLPDVSAIALIRKPYPPKSFGTQANIEVVVADITDAKAVRGAITEAAPSHIINATSYGVRPEERAFRRSEAVNLTGAYHLISASAAGDVRRFVQIGSYSEYGQHDKTLSEHVALRPDSPYAATKAAASLLLQDMRLCGSMETVVARAFHMWGPGEPPHRLTSQVIAASRAKKPLKLTSGTQVKDFTYVADAARWICALALSDSKLDHGVYNVAGGRRCSVKEFALDVANKVNGSSTFEFGARNMPQREPPNGTADNSRLQDAIGPLTQTPFDDAVSATIAASQP